MVNAVEWFAHKHILHGLGKKKNSFWAFHWHRHHHRARQGVAMYDKDYEGSWFRGPLLKELCGVLALLLPTLMLIFTLPYFVGACWATGMLYLHVHKKAHLNTRWGQRWLSHHYDHHMGKDQDANWCVTFPLFDYIMNTRKKHAELPKR